MTDQRISIDHLLEDYVPPTIPPQAPTRVGIFDTADLTSEDDRRLLEIMRTGGVMLVTLRMTDADIESMRAVMGADADIRRDERMGGAGVEFWRRSQAINYGLLPPDPDPA